MSHLSIADWERLVEMSTISTFGKKEVMIKFVSSLGILSLYLILALFLNLEQDVFFASGLLLVNVVAIGFLLMPLSEVQIRWVTYFTLILFMWQLAYIAFELGDMRGLVFFLGPTVMYYFEMERLSWLRWHIPVFVVASILPIPFLPFDILLRLTIAFVLVFIGIIIYQGNKNRLEIVLLRDSQKGYDVFMKHTLLIEHNVINSISKLVYVSEMLKQHQTDEDSSSLEPLIRILDDEISAINKVISKTDGDTVNNFRI